ncbi:protamine-like protein [Melanotaenia boesemani]|uniref:protamine-like protein n=1 Tax=Melanotaenia boesemani TaxID=1250792 RepID=UPI001C0569A9|nr:protamine-like protein [Melanotaenia boesemani]
MSSAVIALPSAPAAKSPKKKAKRKTAPSVSSLILKAVAGSQQRGGVSLAALKKIMKAGGYDAEKNKARIRIALRRLVAKKALVKTKGAGASGSFKLNKKPPKPRKRKVVKKKKPKAKRVKKAKKKAAATSKAKKSPKKKRKTKSPKKAKKAAKKPTKPKSPRKTKRKVARSAKTRAAAKK